MTINRDKYTDGHGKFAKKNPGRPRGSKNHSSKELVEKILGALDELGGQAYLKKLGKEDPKLLTALLSRVIPKDVHISGNVTFEDRLAELERSHAQLGGEQTKSALPPPK
jgi:hypothetical protein